MDRKILIYVFVLLIVAVQSEVPPESTTVSNEESAIEVTEKGSEKCITKLYGCSIDFKGADLSMTKGEKGENGKDGAQGDKGDMGDTGPIGFDGVGGPEGPPGKNGENGKDGAQGDKGDKGDIGEMGPRGHDGLSGDCLNESHEEPSDVAKTKTGTIEDPLPSCKYADKYFDNPGKYYINKCGKPFPVFCDKEKKATCVNLISTNNDYRIIEEKSKQHKNETFWLSEMGTDWIQLYNKLTTEQIYWFQRQSLSSISQRIKYHCKNCPTWDSTSEKALRLLSWKETLIGPNPSEDTPYSYKIEEGGWKDSEEKSEWKHIVLKLNSTTVSLPIIDFNIRDTNYTSTGEKIQKFYIEIEELCFHW